MRMPFSALLISKDSPFLNTLIRALSRAKMQNEVCTDAAEVARRIESRNFSAIVVDCDGMPSGCDLLETLAATTEHHDKILLAAVDDRTPISLAFEAGADLVLQKPLSSEMADRAVRAVQGLRLRDERRHVRHSLEVPVKLQRQEGAQVRCASRDIGEGGICLKVSGRLSPGETVALQFELPEIHSQMELRGQVKWMDQDGQAGIQFLPLDPTAQSELHEWLGHRPGPAHGIFIQSNLN